MKIQPGTVAVVTGAGSGIGRALARNLAARGCALALADVKAERLVETAELVRPAASAVTTCELDVADRDAVARFAETVIEAHGGVQLLINNAGVALIGTAEEVSLDNIAWLLNINFWGMVYGVKAFLPVLKQQPAAHIVNLSSVSGLLAPAGQAAYAASKFAVRGFSESLRTELAATSVRVSCVHPGGVRTNIARDARVDSVNVGQSEQAKAVFERTSRLPPEKAAEIILRGVEANRARILIGQDAHMLDIIQRLAPVRGPALLQNLAERMMRAR